MISDRRIIVFPGQNQIECREEQVELEPPLKGAILQTRYSCISVGTETAKLTGLQKVAYPFKPGNRAVCRVLAIGAECPAGVKEGDLVLTHSLHTSLCAYEGFMAPLPDELDRPETSLLAMGLVSFVGVQQSAAQLGDTALVTGGGIVGNLAAQLLKLSGVTVILADIAERRREIAMNCGIPHTIGGSCEEVQRFTYSLTEGLGARIGLECTGRPEVCAWHPTCLERGGRMVLVGSPRGQSPDMTNFLNHFHLFRPHSDLKLIGAHEWKIPAYPIDYHPHSMLRNVKILGQLLAEDRLKIAPGYYHAFKPEEASAAYRLVMDTSASPLGVVFDWGS